MKTLIRTMAMLALVAALAPAQQRRGAIDAGSYKIDAQVDLDNQILRAAAEVVFTPEDDRLLNATFELHGGLNVTRVTDQQGRILQAARSYEDSSVRVSFAEPLEKGKPASLKFEYEGRLTGNEEGPVFGISFAAISGKGAYFLYPARWFPVTGYTADRFTMDLTVEAPAGFRVVASGLERAEGNKFNFRTTQPGFAGSFALVRGAAQRVSAEGFNADVWFHDEAAKPREWGEQAGKVMNYLTSVFGLPPVSTVALVETGARAPGGYSAPGILFVSTGQARRDPSERVLANQLTRQWYGNLVSPVNRNHIWIANGMAKYAEVLFQVHANGEQVTEPEIRDLYVDAMTVTEAPVLQAARYEDYSPEFFAVTGSKGAATLHMLRAVIGDEKFGQLLKAVPEQFANRSLNTDDFRKLAEQLSGKNLQGFFIQWLESTGAPEFKVEYTILRTQSGFMVRGKITQDLDTFRMPVQLKIETEGNPEFEMVEVVGPQTDFLVTTFGKPRRVVVDPETKVLRMTPQMRVAVAIRRGEQFAEVGAYNEALQEYQRALEVNRISSLAHYRVAEIFFLQGNWQSAANEFREVINGDLEPAWTEVWSHINLGKIFDVTQQRERAINEYTQAIRTKDNTQGAQEEAAKYMKEPYQRESRS
jgi:tetratricopeptide (TPR) repeat protein